ncbi:hypothetical protein LOK49_LG02G02694 [Camellia lanceoleosa]|uniref:Uncharacterized protein n=1 Tax=Camellia lanceoleosa TaxID=1840588 RepID=A0ACC0IJS6_9ERIC|nr:hypothetical protein LOK49_LG02G02694 [Camellia lanceoleosa]
MGLLSRCQNRNHWIELNPRADSVTLHFQPTPSLTLTLISSFLVSDFKLKSDPLLSLSLSLLLLPYPPSSLTPDAALQSRLAR